MRLSEKELISLIRRKLEQSATSKRVIVGPGDDAAVLEAPSGEAVVLSTDAIVQDVHFALHRCTGFLLGQKALLSSVSDVVAMGARPDSCLCSLGLPASTEVSFVEDLFDGMLMAARPLGVSVIGGNISRSDKLFVSMTATGTAQKDLLLKRSGAREGDLIYVTGELGGAALAASCFAKGEFSLEQIKVADCFLRAGCSDDSLSEEQAAVVELVRSFFTPSLRLNEALLLASERISTAMIDISDGIASDLEHVCFESGVGAAVEVDSVPVFGRIKRPVECVGPEMSALAINGGEDYELLFTVGPENEPRLRHLFTERNLCSITKIGHIVARSEELTYVDGRGSPVSGQGGFDHFAKGQRFE
ncbi:MAG: thiamine-phosphate kinase [Candidatus Coatesbacteria bacterium]|nr:thiamine-phosphate kinase [Candidatus Coatesbacteria bacterium]